MANIASRGDYRKNLQLQNYNACVRSTIRTPSRDKKQKPNKNHITHDSVSDKAGMAKIRSQSLNLRILYRQAVALILQRKEC